MAPVTVKLELSPRSRLAVMDLAPRARRSGGEDFEAKSHALYCSHHTTAGFVEHGPEKQKFSRDSSKPPQASKPRGAEAHVKAFQELFPPGAGYQHDQLHLRDELDESQKAVEPLNGDSHLTFIGSGLASCITIPNQPNSSVPLIDLDGVNGSTRRRRKATVVGYDTEELVSTFIVEVPVGSHRVEALNLRDPSLGFLPRIGEELAGLGIDAGRVDVTLAEGEENAALTVNEYETLLMRKDLTEVLEDPLRFAAERGRHAALADLSALPGRTASYARFDFVRILNHGLDRLGLSGSFAEKVLHRLLSLPASKLLHFRRMVSLPIAPDEHGTGQLLQGQYQSPILFQWRRAEADVRHLQVRVSRFT